MAKDLQQTSQKNTFKDSRLKLLIKDQVYVSTAEKQREIDKSKKNFEMDLSKMRITLEKDK